MSIIVIADNPQGSEIAPFASAIQQSINSNSDNRNFEVRASVVTFDQTLDINPPNGNNFYSFRGYGLNSTRFVRDCPGPLIKSSAASDSEIKYLHFYGISFDGRKNIYSNASPLLHIAAADGSFFERCRFANNAGDGVRFGRYVGTDIDYGISMSRFISCEFSNNDQSGLFVDSYDDLSLIGCSFESNGHAGAYFGTPHGIPSTGQPWGQMSVLGCRFVDNGGGGTYPGIDITASKTVSVENCYLRNNDLRFGYSSTRCLSERNILEGAAAIRDYGVSNTSTGNLYYPGPPAPAASI